MPLTVSWKSTKTEMKIIEIFLRKQRLVELDTIINEALLGMQQSSGETHTARKSEWEKFKAERNDIETFNNSYMLVFGSSMLLMLGLLDVVYSHRFSKDFWSGIFALGAILAAFGDYFNPAKSGTLIKASNRYKMRMIGIMALLSVILTILSALNY
jgi:hypothetical protein